jgi:hypothetical protein
MYKNILFGILNVVVALCGIALLSGIILIIKYYSNVDASFEDIFSDMFIIGPVVWFWIKTFKEGYDLF